MVDRTRLNGPRQVTDAYLLALATHHDGQFVSFDRSVPLSAVPGARPENLTILKEIPLGGRLCPAPELVRAGPDLT